MIESRDAGKEKCKSKAPVTLNNNTGTEVLRLCALKGSRHQPRWKQNICREKPAPSPM